MQFFGIENVRKSDLDLPLYGIIELDKLLEIFGNDKKTINSNVETVYHKIVDSIDTRNEWRLFKRMIKGNYLDCNNNTFWQQMMNDLSFQTHFPNIKKLAFIANILPMSTAICERGFSTMNFIKDDFRNKIGDYSFYYDLFIYFRTK